VASLALFRTQLKFGSEGVQISFGSSTQATPTPGPVAPQVTVAGLGKEEVQRLIEARLTEIEQAQTVRFERTLMEAKKEWQAQRKEDWQQVSAGLSYLEANQKSMVQDTARNSTYIQSLANIYARAERPASLQ
jgi:hypothetical protein